MRSVSVCALVCQGEGGGEELFAPAVVNRGSRWGGHQGAVRVQWC